ncbi:sporulation protein YabP [Gottschalkia acidurici 9a]|uniref:Sporulation protein YabP n=1 Tax=Gottschalkia acidurici (strain ATCC 7906 / DSM 604 / BCRC 14475 / CIP 104303 / KCTC 5404 / NCIMB 10678 / 9a) TaxID=1128398 RepID=K0B4A7_GOTA9|nr:sporulation protein YabP [Gottschalkia acidurici]AFS79371.1 sporulation protein YabP [Gottschalkia acidurici 9a]
MNDDLANLGQNIILEDRSKLSISGVEQVDNFNENTISLGTVRGGITIKGEDLNISKLNLEDGNVIIDGTINSITYINKEATGGKGGGFLGKMFK